MKKGKIIYLIDDLNIGGLERTVEVLCMGLKDQYDISVWTLIGKGKIYQKLEDAGIRMEFLGYPKKGPRFPLIWALAKEFKKNKIDILHTHGFSANAIGTFASLLARSPTKIIYHVQNTYYDLSFKNILKEKVITRFADKIIACSQAVKQCMKDYIRVNPEKLEVIYNSSSLNSLELDNPEKIRKEFRISDNDFVICSVGRLTKIKGHIHLINAMQKVLGKYPNTKLIIAGEGPLREQLKKRVQELNISDRVILAELRNDVGDILSASDIFIQPSIIREGLPLSIVEAMSRKLPVIATDVGGNNEAVKDGFNGFIIPDVQSETIAGKINYFIANRNKTSDMGEKSCNLYLRNFTPEVLCSRITSAYEELLFENLTR